MIFYSCCGGSCAVVFLSWSSHPAGTHDDALSIQIQLGQQLLHRLQCRESKATHSSRAEDDSVCVTEGCCCGEPPDLSLVVADKHGGVTFHNRWRQGLEMTPEVAQSHVLGIT